MMYINVVLLTPYAMNTIPIATPARSVRKNKKIFVPFTDALLPLTLLLLLVFDGVLLLG